MEAGNIIRQANGADYSLWRVDETYEADSPYVFGILVSNSKYNKAGSLKRMLRKEDYKVEPDPVGYAKGHGFTVNLTVTPEKASWT